MEPTSKERILKKIRSALRESTPQPYPNVEFSNPIYQPQKDDLDVTFAEEFTKIQGNFIYCEHKHEFIRNLDALLIEKSWTHLFCWEYDLQQMFQQLDFRKVRIGKNLERADAGITLVECLIARTGTILLSSRLDAGRSLSIFPPVHIVVAYTSQLMYDMKEALAMLMQKYDGAIPSMINLATGPSRTADIEKTLVLGAHGPKEVYVFLIDDSGTV